jgi:hypothetical protein
MIWLTAALFAAIGIALIAARAPLARGQGLVIGGRIPAGCVIAEGVAFIVLAALMVVFRRIFFP